MENLKKKILAILGAVILVWWLSPLPEISIILGILGWKVVPLSWPYNILGILGGVCIGLILGYYFKIGERIKEKLEQVQS
ncbi:hypothetical protein AKJ64_03505 [candidate division MSBL1 archaeon SCGC-AAA259E17]|uniref:Uncharacterized protein n=1 Tax=candidate division MSBL1 archaeon SCGC-AAA259E17 TaxID=1698263 RepID=A0A133UDK8_9EURY|nr:hypothetical protein AKJ64_03505 [candidate division MSBL1 archaeon SCGC-AAA259E17]